LESVEEVADAEEDEEEKASTANNADDGSSKNNVLMNRESIISLEQNDGWKKLSSLFGQITTKFIQIIRVLVLF
jgi:hypothetical protein